MRSALYQEGNRIDFFEKAAPYYDLLLDILTFGMYAQFLRRAVKILNPKRGEKILDVCSGTGRAVSWIAQAVGKDGEAVGIDLSRRMIGVAVHRYSQPDAVRFIRKDVTEPWDYRNHFDGILASFSLHELPEAERFEVLTRSYSALKDAGRMVIADFNPKGSRWGKPILNIFFKLFERENLNFFSMDQEEMLKEAGFKKVRTFLILSGLLQITLAHRDLD